MKASTLAMQVLENELQGLSIDPGSLFRAAVRGGLVRLETTLLQLQGQLLYVKTDVAGDLTATVGATGLKKPQTVLLLQRFYLKELPPQGEAAVRRAVQEVAQLTTNPSGESPEQPDQ